MNDITANEASPTARPRKPATRARQSVKSTIDRSRNKVQGGVARLRSRADDAVEAGASLVDESPLTAIAGALAVGATVAALLPATRQEAQAIGPFGDRIRGALDASFAAAKSAGAEQLTARGLSSTALSSGLSGIVVSIIQASLAANRAQKAAPEPVLAAPVVEEKSVVEPDDLFEDDDDKADA